MKFCPYKKGGGGKSFSYPEGGHNKFSGTIFHMGGRKMFNPVVRGCGW